MCPILSGFRYIDNLLYSTLYKRATQYILTLIVKCIDVGDRIFENVRIIHVLGKLHQLCHLNNKYIY
jgi:hypothetical protein